MNVADGVRLNVRGWWAVREVNGAWIGTDEGVTCYRDRDLARVALTILWQRDGGGPLKLEVAAFTGADLKVGRHRPAKDAVTALRDYEKGRRRSG